MKEAYILAIARTPVGNLAGSLGSLSAIDLGKVAMQAVIERAGITSDQIDEVFMGNVLQANVGQAPAKQAALAAGIPDSVPCTTVNKVCSSGMKSIMFGVQSILLGDNDIVLAGGMESMTQTPHYLPSGRSGIKYGDGQIIDGIKRDGLQDPYDQSMMGNCAEVCARDKNISREEQDDYAYQSYVRARNAYEKGYFKNEIVPVPVPQRRGEPVMVDRDDEVFNKRVVDREGFNRLRPAFEKTGTVTAANASTINDGSAAVILISGEKAKELGLKPIAKVLSYADASQEPVWFTTSPSLAMPKAMEKAGLKTEDFDAFEINEAFSVVALANMQALGLDHAKVNQFGGGVSIGHPIGVSGCRIMVTLISVLQATGGKRGLAGICNGGGGASAMAIEMV